MKAVLEFSLPEESEEHMYAVNGIKYAIAIDEVDNKLRAKLKYEELSDEQIHAFEAVRVMIREALQDLPLN